MGTNYYCETGRMLEVECDCGFKHVMPEVLHIGKDSFGWKFTLHEIPEKGLVDLKTWKHVLEMSPRIYDEYGGDVGLDEMVDTIRKKVDLRTVTKDRKERMMDSAGKYGYFLDTRCWLFGGELGRKQGKDGNYSMMGGDFS